jgi:DNA-directed RNA polymerase specialized sigma24 family protein
MRTKDTTEDTTNDTETTTMKTIDDDTIDTNDTTTTEALGTPDSSNDNGTSVATPDTTFLLTHDSVVRPIAGTLKRYGVEPQDMSDAIAEVQTLALEAARRGKMPADAGEWKALCTTIAARWAIERLRDQEVRDRYEDGLCEEPDAYMKPTLEWEGRDPVDTKRYLAVLKGLFDSGQMPEGGAEILWGEAEEVGQDETAEELGICQATLRSRLFRMRQIFRERLAELGMLTILVLVGAMLGTQVGGVAQWGGAKPDVPVHVVTPQERAAGLRHEGMEACEERRWEECLERLDRAARIDPVGDQALEVQEARRLAEEGEEEQRPLRLEAKPR